MSYRSLKRVLGETHLELKCLLLFGACALLLTCVSFWVYGSQTKKLVHRQNRHRGASIVNNILLSLHWKKLGEPGHNGQQLVDFLSAAIETEPYDWERLLAIGVKISSKGQELPLDGFEHKVLEQFARATAPANAAEIEWQEQHLPNQKQYHYYQAVRAAPGKCATCHSQIHARLVPTRRPQPVKDGDLLAVMKVRISDAPVQADIRLNNAILWGMAIATAFALVVASYFIIRYVIAKPVKHLQGVSEAISRGEMDKRAEINTGDEFEALGTAFNKMVHSLVDSQEQIRHTNAELDRRVDELAQLNMQLYEMNRLKSDFLATVSHELRTPLNSIIGFSDVLWSVPALDEKYRRYVQNIQTSGKMLLEMINDILDLAKIEAGKMELRPAEFRIDHVVHAQCDMMRPMAEKKNIDLEIDIEPGLSELRHDQYKVQQILNNLLSNAVKFTPDGGRVVVRALSAGSGNFYLVVSDTGVGIAEADQSKIFEKFRQGTTVLQGGDAMTREYSGTGLGLSIVKELCKLLGGEISLQSELGKGSTFTVRLPIRLPAQPEADAFSPTAASDGLGSSRRVEFGTRSRQSLRAD